jgi:hypothetical protein
VTITVPLQPELLADFPNIKFLEVCFADLEMLFLHFQANRTSVLVHKLINKTKDPEIREEVQYVDNNLHAYYLIYIFFLITFPTILTAFVVREPGYRSQGPGLIPGATRFSKK